MVNKNVIMRYCKISILIIFTFCIGCKPQKSNPPINFIYKDSIATIGLMPYENFDTSLIKKIEKEIKFFLIVIL